MAEERKVIPVWFFVGVILFIYGIIICISGIYQISHPPAVVLVQLHAPIWWGAVLFLFGGLFTYLFWPRKSKQDVSASPKVGS